MSKPKVYNVITKEEGYYAWGVYKPEESLKMVSIKDYEKLKNTALNGIKELAGHDRSQTASEFYEFLNKEF